MRNKQGQRLSCWVALMLRLESWSMQRGDQLQDQTLVEPLPFQEHRIGYPISLSSEFLNMENAAQYF